MADATELDRTYDFILRHFVAHGQAPHFTAIAQAFADYLATPNYEKAFVIGPGGAYGWASGYNTADAALAAAREQCEQNCKVVYAIDDTLADAAAGSQPPAPPASSAPATTPAAAAPRWCGDCCMGRGEIGYPSSSR